MNKMNNFRIYGIFLAVVFFFNMLVSEIGAQTGPNFLWEVYPQEGIAESNFTQPRIVDLDGDGTKEIISALQDSSSNTSSPVVKQGIYVWDSNGNLRNGFPVFPTGLQTLFQSSNLSIVSVGDVTGDGKLEIIAAMGRGSVNLTQEGIFVISENGTVLAVLNDLNKSYGFAGINETFPVLSDLDNDGILEIIAVPVVGAGSGNPSLPAFIWKYDKNSQQFVNYSSNWPKILSPRSFGVSKIAVVDFANNGNKTIIVAFLDYPSGSGYPDSHLMAINPDGTTKWLKIFPTSFPNIYRIEKLISGDVDGDGSIELVASVLSITASSAVYEVYIYDQNGNVKYQWSISTSQLQGGIARESFSLADMDQDGTLEIIFAVADPSNPNFTSYIYVADYNTGKIWPGFPVSVGVQYEVLQSLGIADLNGDGYPDIYGIVPNKNFGPQVGNYYYAFIAVDRFGNFLPGYPFPILNRQTIPANASAWFEKYPPTVADINSDGLVDIVTSHLFGRLIVHTLNVPYHNGGYNYCPEFGCDAQNTKIVKDGHGPHMTLSSLGNNYYAGQKGTLQGGNNLTIDVHGVVNNPNVNTACYAGVPLPASQQVNILGIKWGLDPAKPIAPVLMGNLTNPLSQTYPLPNVTSSVEMAIQCLSVNQFQKLKNLGLTQMNITP